MTRHGLLNLGGHGEDSCTGAHCFFLSGLLFLLIPIRFAEAAQSISYRLYEITNRLYLLIMIQGSTCNLAIGDSLLFLCQHFGYSLFPTDFSSASCCCCFFLRLSFFTHDSLLLLQLLCEGKLLWGCCFGLFARCLLLELSLSLGFGFFSHNLLLVLELFGKRHCSQRLCWCC